MVYEKTNKQITCSFISTGITNLRFVNFGNSLSSSSRYGSALAVI